MALLQVDYLSEALFRQVTLSVILPVDKIDYDKRGYIPDKAPYKTLYLLHGLLGDHTDWVSRTRIRIWAEEKNLAVVMPSGDNSFYFKGRNPDTDYGKFIGEELLEVTRKMFPLSHKREDTFIGGLSMGGYGAIRNGIIYSENFSHVIGLSAAVHFFEYEEEDIYAVGLLDDKEKAKNTDLNPKVAFDELIARKGQVPRFYMACGRQDDLMPANISLRDYLLKKGADITWYEEDAAHEWDFWDSQIKKALEWLPL